MERASRLTMVAAVGHLHHIKLCLYCGGHFVVAVLDLHHLLLLGPASIVAVPVRLRREDCEVPMSQSVAARAFHPRQNRLV